jgi:hypothetical protein
MTLLQDVGLPAEHPIRGPEPALSIRALAEQDHQGIHEILTSPSVIEGTMRLPHDAAHKPSNASPHDQARLTWSPTSTATQSAC